MKILLAEDDAAIREGLTELLEGEGYEVRAAADGAAALDVFRAEAPALALLDIMMPKLSGYDLCRRIVAEAPGTPVIFLSARTEEIDRVLGLELGADDYICKPFGAREVIARIRAVTRRVYARPSPDGEATADAAFAIDDLEVLPAELRARRGGAVIDLSLREVRILAVLARERGKVVSRDQLFDECWGYDHVPNSRTLDQHISRLRKKIEPDPGEPTLIRTVHGAGYRIER